MKGVLEKKTLGSIDLDDIDRPLRVVEECMQRLELKHQMNEQARNDDDSTTSPSSSSSSSSIRTDDSISENSKLEDECSNNIDSTLNIMDRASVCVTIHHSSMPLFLLYFFLLYFSLIVLIL